MTVSSQQSEVPYAGDGVTKVFPIPFYFLQSSDIQIIINDALGNLYPAVQNVDYTVTGAGNQAGGSATFGVAPVSGRTVTIQRIVPATQLTDYQPNDDFPAETHERALDKLTMLVQQIIAGFGRALVRPVGKNYYDAEGLQIKNIDDPTESQDAATLGWSTDFIASILATGQGPVNNSANVIFSGANGYIGVVQDLANKLDPQKGSRMLGHDGWTVGDRLDNMKFPEQFASISAWAASGGSLGIKAGTYSITAGLKFAESTTSLTTFGDVVIDASAANAMIAFPDSAAVYLGGGSHVLMADLNQDYSRGANLITFASAHNLQPGDIFVIYNPTNQSYSSFRNEYRAGEFCRVAAVIGSTQVRLCKPLYASYVAAAVDVYKLNGCRFNLRGSLRVIAPETLPLVRAVKAVRLIDSGLTNLQAYSKQTVAALEIDKCFNVEGDNLRLEQGLLTGQALDYGLSISNSQHIRMDGIFSASRHAITTTGYADIGSVPCRDIKCGGTASTTFEGGVGILAIGLHGNTEYFEFDGDVYGGFLNSGNHNVIRGKVFSTFDGICVYHSELSGYDHDYSGVELYSTANTPASRGVFDLGGDNTTSAATDTAGGTLNLSGMVVYAPLASSVFRIINRFSQASDIRVKLDGAQVAQAAAGYESVRIASANGGAAIASASMLGFDDPGAANQIMAASELTGVSFGGFVDIPVTTGQSSASAVVTFPSGRFKDAPIVTTGINTRALGATTVGVNTNSPTTSSVTITVGTLGGANFGAAGTIRAFWSARTVK